MAKITFIDSAGTARTVEGVAGSTVMETAINNGVPEIEAECGGACACSTCHVYIDETWREKVGEPSPMEEDMLDFAYNVQPNSRLSCQIKVTDALDGLIVRTPERQALSFSAFSSNHRPCRSMIPKCGYRVSEKIMLQQNAGAG